MRIKSRPRLKSCAAKLLTSQTVPVYLGIENRQGYDESQEACITLAKVIGVYYVVLQLDAALEKVVSVSTSPLSQLREAL